MGFFTTIGKGIDALCGLVWRGLQALWSIIKKVFSKIVEWTLSIVGWLAKVAVKVAAATVAAVVVFFIWIFGEDDGLESQTGSESTLENNIKDKLNDPNRKIIVVKGVFNKDTQKIEGDTEIEASNTISSQVINQTGGNRFAELQAE